MKSLYEYILDSEKQLNKDMIFEMANISTSKTGLSFIVWVQTSLPGNHGQHNSPRVKVQNKDKQLIPVSIEDTPKILGGIQLKDTGWSGKDFKEISQWVIVNKDQLLKLWNGEITSDEFIDCMIKN